MPQTIEYRNEFIESDSTTRLLNEYYSSALGCLEWLVEPYVRLLSILNGHHYYQCVESVCVYHYPRSNWNGRVLTTRAAVAPVVSSCARYSTCPSDNMSRLQHSLPHSPDRSVRGVGTVVRVRISRFFGTQQQHRHRCGRHHVFYLLILLIES